MKRNAIATLAVTVVASLALTGTALAGSKTIQQTGQIVGDSGSQVKLRVKVKNGDATQLSGFKAKQVITRCDGVNKRYDYLALSPIPLNSVDQFDAVLTDNSIGLKIKLQGEVKNNGKAVAGTIKTNKFQVKQETCKVSKQKFKTAK
jgi:hypothetical protein